MNQEKPILLEKLVQSSYRHYLLTFTLGEAEYAYVQVKRAWRRDCRQ